ncbi:MAG: response regulator [Actinomycetota bacterium]
MARIKVLVADSQLSFSDALAISLRLQPDIEVLFDHPTSAQDAVKAVVKVKPDVALVDYWLPGMEGSATTKMILSQARGQKVIVLSWFHGPRHIQEALDAGVAGFLPKSLLVPEIAEAIRRAHTGETPIYAEETGRLLAKIDKKYQDNLLIWNRLKNLTEREIVVLTLLSLGHSKKEVAEQLFIAPGTVKNHLHKMLVKSGARTLTELAAMARSCGLIV